MTFRKYVKFWLKISKENLLIFCSGHRPNDGDKSNTTFLTLRLLLKHILHSQDVFFSEFAFYFTYQ